MGCLLHIDSETQICMLNGLNACQCIMQYLLITYCEIFYLKKLVFLEHLEENILFTVIGCIKGIGNKYIDRYLNGCCKV